MISLEKLKRIDPSLSVKFSDEELEKIKSSLYELGQVLFDKWLKEKFNSKNLAALLTNEDNKTKI